MSAESPRQRQNLHSVVLPQPVTDKSIIDSVAGFIHEVVPPAYTNVLPGENKEKILWAKFERPDLFDPFIFSETSDIDAYENVPLLLIVGHNTGAKIWSISINGEATEVLSFSDSVIKCLRLLPTPLPCPPGDSCCRQDAYTHKRPLIALCDNSGSAAPFCMINFISLRTGEQVKAIQFKTPICDIQANRRSLVIVFPERIAVFDAFTLEDQLTVTTCFPSPSINPNPVALGSRWLAFSEKQMILMKRSRGGSEGEGVQSYTATVLQAAKTLGKGLRDFSGSVTSSLTGSGPPIINGNNAVQPGIITILDVESSNGKSTKNRRGGEIIVHFIAHSEPIVAMNFDPSGMLLVTADKRGHRFHVFRINPHPAGSASASVHHLYILHRGDTTARVQDISFSNDSRWVAVSSLRGTTHVFPITPYGGSIGLRTHATPHVVNKLSRFHRSAGLINDGRNSPVLNECNQQLQMLAIPNPCLPPYPSPIVITPLAQLRTYPPGISATRGHEDVAAMVKVAACFAPPRAWLSSSRETLPSKTIKRAVDSLFIMTCHGNLVQYDLEPRHVIGVTKDKICDNTQIELGIEAKAEWPLVHVSSSTPLPLNNNNLLLLMTRPFSSNNSDKYQAFEADERWLSQVEIVTHAGPHRRLWMGPQFMFKTYNSSVGSAVPVMESDNGSRLNRSSPVNMPLSHNSVVPVLLESGSSSSYEQSPCLLDMCGSEVEKLENEGESRLQEDLADAMQEGPGIAIPSDAGGEPSRARAPAIARQVNPLGTVINLSEGVSMAASTEILVPIHELSKVVCCDEQSSQFSIGSSASLDLSRIHSQSKTMRNERVLNLDGTQIVSEISSSITVKGISKSISEKNIVKTGRETASAETVKSIHMNLEAAIKGDQSVTTSIHEVADTNELKVFHESESQEDEKESITSEVALKKAVHLEDKSKNKKDKRKKKCKNVQSKIIDSCISENKISENKSFASVTKKNEPVENMIDTFYETSDVLNNSLCAKYLEPNENDRILLTTTIQPSEGTDSNSLKSKKKPNSRFKSSSLTANNSVVKNTANNIAAETNFQNVPVSKSFSAVCRVSPINTSNCSIAESEELNGKSKALIISQSPALLNSLNIEGDPLPVLGFTKSISLKDDNLEDEVENDYSKQNHEEYYSNLVTEADFVNDDVGDDGLEDIINGDQSGYVLENDFPEHFVKDNVKSDVWEPNLDVGDDCPKLENSIIDKPSISKTSNSKLLVELESDEKPKLSVLEMKTLRMEEADLLEIDIIEPVLNTMSISSQNDVSKSIMTDETKKIVTLDKNRLSRVDFKKKRKSKVKKNNSFHQQEDQVPTKSYDRPETLKANSTECKWSDSYEKIETELITDGDSTPTCYSDREQLPFEFETENSRRPRKTYILNSGGELSGRISPPLMRQINHCEDINSNSHEFVIEVDSNKIHDTQLLTDSVDASVPIAEVLFDEQNLKNEFYDNEDVSDFNEPAVTQYPDNCDHYLSASAAEKNLEPSRILDSSEFQDPVDYVEITSMIVDDNMCPENLLKEELDLKYELIEKFKGPDVCELNSFDDEDNLWMNVSITDIQPKFIDSTCEELDSLRAYENSGDLNSVDSMISGQKEASPMSNDLQPNNKPIESKQVEKSLSRSRKNKKDKSRKGYRSKR